jgi:hypothetical protein
MSALAEGERKPWSGPRCPADGFQRQQYTRKKRGEGKGKKGGTMILLISKANCVPFHFLSLAAFGRNEVIRKKGTGTLA